MLDDETRVKPVSPALYLASVEKLSQCPTAHPVRGRQIVPPPFIQETCSWSSAPAIQIRDFDSTTATTLSVRLFASHPGRIRVCACWTCPITRREGTAALSLCDGGRLGRRVSTTDLSDNANGSITSHCASLVLFLYLDQRSSLQNPHTHLDAFRAGTPLPLPSLESPLRNSSGPCHVSVRGKPPRLGADW